MTATIDTQRQSESSKLLQNRVVLVTGASRGIGAATAKLLARHGAMVGVNYYSSDSAAQQVVEEIQMGRKFREAALAHLKLDKKST